MVHPFGAAAFVHPSGTRQVVGVGVEQSKLVVGGVVVQVQGCGAGDSMMVYLTGSVPHSHHPRPSAIAAQVLSESAAWQHVTDVASAEVGERGAESVCEVVDPALVMEAGIRGKVRLDVCVALNSLAISIMFTPAITISSTVLLKSSLTPRYRC